MEDTSGHRRSLAVGFRAEQKWQCVGNPEAPRLERLEDVGLEDLRLTRELYARFFNPWP